jgi:hypothetical protein
MSASVNEIQYVELYLEACRERQQRPQSLFVMVRSRDGFCFPVARQEDRYVSSLTMMVAVGEPNPSGLHKVTEVARRALFLQRIGAEETVKLGRRPGDRGIDWARDMHIYFY